MGEDVSWKVTYDTDAKMVTEMCVCVFGYLERSSQVPQGEEGTWHQ